MPYTLTIKDGIWHINGKKITLPRDQNFDPVSLSAGFDADGNIAPVTIDPITGGLVITGANDEATYLQQVLSRPPDRVANNQDNTIAYRGWAISYATQNTDYGWIILKSITVTDSHGNQVQEVHWTKWDFSNKWDDYINDSIYY